MEDLYDLVVVGMGAAGLAAGLGALEAAEERASDDVSIAIIEPAPAYH